MCADGPRVPHKCTECWHRAPSALGFPARLFAFLCRKHGDWPLVIGKPHSIPFCRKLPPSGDLVFHCVPLGQVKTGSVSFFRKKYFFFLFFFLPFFTNSRWNCVWFRYSLHWFPEKKSLLFFVIIQSVLSTCCCINYPKLGGFKKRLFSLSSEVPWAQGG